jgi:hypothetical protein
MDPARIKEKFSLIYPTKNNYRSGTNGNAFEAFEQL